MHHACYGKVPRTPPVSTQAAHARFISIRLGSLFLLTQLLAVAQIRIQLRVPEYGWTTQKVFHLLNFLVAGLRAGVFASWDHVRALLRMPGPFARMQATCLWAIRIYNLS